MLFLEGDCRILNFSTLLLWISCPNLVSPADVFKKATQTLAQYARSTFRCNLFGSEHSFGKGYYNHSTIFGHFRKRDDFYDEYPFQYNSVPYHLINKETRQIPMRWNQEPWCNFRIQDFLLNIYPTSKNETGKACVGQNKRRNNGFMLCRVWGQLSTKIVPIYFFENHHLHCEKITWCNYIKNLHQNYTKPKMLLVDSKSELTQKIKQEYKRLSFSDHSKFFVFFLHSIREFQSPWCNSDVNYITISSTPQA